MGEKDLLELVERDASLRVIQPTCQVFGSRMTRAELILVRRPNPICPTICCIGGSVDADALLLVVCAVCRQLLQRVRERRAALHPPRVAQRNVLRWWADRLCLVVLALACELFAHRIICLCTVATDLDTKQEYRIRICKRTEPQMRGAMSTFKVRPRIAVVALIGRSAG